VKNLMILMLGLSLLTGTTAVFVKTSADDTTKTKKTTKSRKTKTKKTASTGTPNKDSGPGSGGPPTPHH